ncbi:MAG: 1-acyl-sn-glycerol-3-phosphate acyltransferase [Burkholderiales bacterium]|nr:1-acyl-sn-glycerol-3-phosphate acyltransferase [Phycisphaerae bacterium]
MSAPTSTEQITEQRSPDRGWLWRFLQIFAAIGVRLIYGLQVRGKENIPRNGGVLIVSNHQSFLDPVLVSVMLDRPFAYLAEAYLFKVKPLAILIRALNAFPIQQGRGDIGAMKEMIRLLQAGQVLNVFAEGTRTPDGTLQPVQGGIALAVRRAGVPVVPMAIAGAYEAWPRHRKLPRPGKIRIIYGKPIELHHLKNDQIIAEVERSVGQLFEEATRWREES